MKFFLIACLAVAVMAESDPNLILTNGVYHPVASSYIHSPLVSPLVSSYIAQPTILKAEEKPEVTEKKVEEVEEKMPQQMIYSSMYPTTQYIQPFVQPYFKPVVVGPRYVAKNGEVHHIVHKREAEPWTVYGNQFYSGLHYPHHAYQPAVYSNKATFVNPFTGDVTGKVTNDAILPTNYAGKGTYVARAPGSPTVHIAKREADPLTVVSSPYMYSHPFAYNTPVAYQAPVVYNTPVYKTVASPLIYNAPTGAEGVVDGKTVADDAWQFTPNYAGKGMYEAKTPGTVHRARRDADPLTVVHRSPFYRTVYPNSYDNLFHSRVVRPVNTYSPYSYYY